MNLIPQVLTAMADKMDLTCHKVLNLQPADKHFPNLDKPEPKGVFKFFCQNNTKIRNKNLKIGKSYHIFQYLRQIQNRFEFDRIEHYILYRHEQHYQYIDFDLSQNKIGEGVIFILHFFPF